MESDKEEENTRENNKEDIEALAVAVSSLTINKGVNILTIHCVLFTR